MKNKRGFTLIELLAVIVILAIIALIATPIVMNVIENSKKGAAERSAENYLRAVETAIATERLNGPVEDGAYQITSDGNLCKGTVSGTVCKGIKLSVDVSGNKPSNGIIKIENKEVVKAYNFEVNDNYIIFLDNRAQVVDYSTLIPGKEFNAKIKNLANDTTDKTYEALDSEIKSIKFYSGGELPTDKTKEQLELLPNVSVSDDNLIKAYNNNGNIYVCSENQIFFNEISSYMFFGLNELVEISLDGVNTSNVINMSNMFREVKKIENLDLSSFDTSKVKYFRSMFSTVEKITSLDLSNFNTSSAIDMGYMFYMSSLTSLDVSNFNTGNVTNMESMFQYLGHVEHLNVSSFDTSNVTKMGAMFAQTFMLKSLDLRNFDTRKVEDANNLFAYDWNLKDIKGTEGKWEIPSNANTYNMFIDCGTDHVDLVPAT